MQNNSENYATEMQTEINMTVDAPPPSQSLGTASNSMLKMHTAANTVLVLNDQELENICDSFWMDRNNWRQSDYNLPQQWPQ